MISKYKISPGNGHQSVLQVKEKNIAWLGLEVLRLSPGESWQGSLKDDEEAAFVGLSGRFSVKLQAAQEFEWKGIGGRPDIFGGSPYVVYAPRGSKVTISAETKIEIAIAKAPSEGERTPVLIKPEDVKVVSSGVANWRRDVRLVIPPGSPISQRMIIGETINPPGNWSGIPPHKHDELSGIENILEEWYLFKTKPANGYGLQLGYKESTEECDYIHNDDVYFLENGYHPTVASPGTTLGYLWVLSGDNKAYNITTDPRFDWISSAEAVIREMKLS
jgi:5-deoxy-glucuronate isomerase